MDHSDALSLLIDGIIKAPKRLVYFAGEVQELKSRITVLEHEKSNMLDRIILLEKQMKRKKNR